MTTPLTEVSGHGRCNCGGVEFLADELRPVINCHCHRCRRFSGHHLAATKTERARVVFRADSTLRWWSPDPSVAYGFCRECGSSLFWTAHEQPESLTICAGVLDQPTGLTTASAWWMAEHGDYHTPEPGVREIERDG